MITALPMGKGGWEGGRVGEGGREREVRGRVGEGGREREVRGKLGRRGTCITYYPRKDKQRARYLVVS